MEGVLVQTEKSKVEDMLMMIKCLSEFVLKNRVEITEHSMEFVGNLVGFVQLNSLKGMKEVVGVLHKVLKHQDSFMRLSCKQLHCIECYNYFVNDDFYSENTVCSCGVRINPRDRGLINDQFTRLQRLKKDCFRCGIRQDKMNFCELEHPCCLCVSCLYETFQFFSENNVCAYCQQYYSEENSSTIRGTLAEFYDINQVREFYSKNCFMCEVKEDSRNFLQICQNKHFCCEKCKKKLIDSKVQKCKCNSDISLIN